VQPPRAAADWTLPPALSRVKRLLAVVAHPDDESFGLGAVITTIVGAGAEMSVLCLTAGEASTLGAPADLAAVRAAELAAAAAVLGVRARLLGLPDGSLASRPAGELESVVEEHLGSADALLVFEPSGVTGHPDHRAASLAGAAVAARHALPLVEWGLPAPLAGRLSHEFGLLLSGFDTGADVVDIRVDRTRQWAAINEHRSQQPDNPLLRRRLTLQGDREQIRIRPVGSVMR
jgi:LmbE family N-acetylglucosaminyl deacetylase